MAGAAEGRVRLEWPAPGVALLVLDRPAALNALSKRMFSELAAHFRALRAREDVAAAILTGAGDRAFSAGVDLKAAAAVFRSAEGDASAELDVVAQMERCPFPIIGAVNGLAITVGFELALACDVLLCSAAAFFQDTHCRYGIMPSWGLSQKLPRLLGPQRAKYLSLGCVRINARDAFQWGLVSQVCTDRAALDRAALEVATRIKDNHQGVVRGYKKVGRRRWSERRWWLSDWTDRLAGDERRPGPAAGGGAGAGADAGVRVLQRLDGRGLCGHREEVFGPRQDEGREAPRQAVIRAADVFFTRSFYFDVYAMPGWSPARRASPDSESPPDRGEGTAQAPA